MAKGYLEESLTQHQNTQSLNPHPHPLPTPQFERGGDLGSTFGSQIHYLLRWAPQWINIRFSILTKIGLSKRMRYWIISYLSTVKDQNLKKPNETSRQMHADSRNTNTFKSIKINKIDERYKGRSNNEDKNVLVTFRSSLIHAITIRNIDPLFLFHFNFTLILICPIHDTLNLLCYVAWVLLL